MDLENTIEFILQLSGSAKYLHDERKSQDTVRWACKYRVNKRSEQIDADASNFAKNPKWCKDKDKIGATHVVTEVTYGFRAYLIFETEITKTITAKEIEGSLEALIQALPGLNVGGGAQVSISENETIVDDVLRFTFYGDTWIDPPPATYQDAKELTNKLTDKALEDERVISFSIAPLSDYCDESDAILNEISKANNDEVLRIMVEMAEVKMFLAKLKGTKLATDFLRYKEMLLDLETRFLLFQTRLKSGIQKLLPEVRKDISLEDCLTKLVGAYYDSPWRKDKFFTLLNVRQKEIETIESIIYHDELPAPPRVVIDLDKSGDGNECIINNDYLIVYDLEVMPENADKLGEIYEKNRTVNEENKWFNQARQVGKNRPIFKNFLNLANMNNERSICFLISLNKIDSTNSVPFKLTLQKEGENIMENLKRPMRVINYELISKGHDYLKLLVTHSRIKQVDGVLKATLQNTLQSISNDDEAGNDNIHNQAIFLTIDSL